jgi:Glu-tRNA(Gln) amidotransferase subunit E-like FAD-binding protein
MTAPTSIRQKAIALLEQLPDDRLAQAVEFLESLRQPVSQGSELEAELLAVIQRQLSPIDRTRLDDLRSAIEAGTISEAEHQELLAYVERIEQQDAERAAALIQLAQLRQVDLKTLVNEFLPAQNANAL